MTTPRSLLEVFDGRVDQVDALHRSHVARHLSVATRQLRAVIVGKVPPARPGIAIVARAPASYVLSAQAIATAAPSRVGSPRQERARVPRTLAVIVRM